jgi:signal transduction histidine kinase
MPVADNVGRACTEVSKDGNRTRLMGWISSTRSRILAWLIGLICLATAGSILAARQILLLQIYDSIDSSLAQEIEEFHRLLDGFNPVTGEPFGNDIEAVFDVFLARSVPEDDEFFLALLDGDIYASSPIALPEALQFDDSAIARWSTLTEVKQGKLKTPVETLLYKAYPTETSTGTTGVFVVAHSLTNRRQELTQILLIMSSVMGCTFVLALIAAWLVIGQVLVPLELLTETARSIKSADDELDQRIPVRGTQEIALLTETFNDMLSRLRSSFISQRNFINDASHELQTPITVIQGHLELLSQQQGDLPKIIWLMQDELKRMSRLVKDLLLLARAERSDFLDLTMVQVDDLMETIYAKAIAIAPRQWQLARVAKVRIVGDRDRITQAVMNLTQNAVEHTQPADTIELGSRLVNQQIHIWVHNSGSTISLVDQARIFQRFARAPISHHTRSEGAGLGLAIVQAIADAHGGTVILESAPYKGTIFTLVLPLEPPQDSAHP